MAGLVMFRRRWGIASDDFVFPGGFEIFFRIVWLLVVLFTYFLENSDRSNCGDSYGALRGFLISSMVLQGVVFITATVLVVISSLGSLSDDRPRRHIAVVLYLRCFLFLPEAILVVYGVYYIILSDILYIQECPLLIRLVCLFGVILSSIVLLVTLVIVIIIFDPLGASQKLRDERHVNPHLALDSVSVAYRRRAEASNVWETRLRMICCCFVSDTDGNRSALKDVAQLFSEMFEVEMDVVPSDIAAGLVLVQREQENSPPPKAPRSPEFDRPAKPLPWMTATNLHYFSKFALSIYGWPLYIFMNPFSGPFRLLRKISCCSCCRGNPNEATVGVDSAPVFEGDNACRCHLAGLKALLDLPHVRILHCSYQNQVFNSPFLVAVDDEAKAIVIAIRGTMSFMDAITDVMTHCDPIFDDDVTDHDPRIVAHRGILKSAENLIAFFRQSQLLEKTLRVHPDYAVVTTGHSLGAGIAVLLALKLRRQFQTLSPHSSSPSSSVATPEVRCFAFSPPGGLLSADAHKLSRECVMSVVLDIDFIPRLSFHTFVKLKENLIRQIEKADEPKFEILAKGCWSALGRCAVECCGGRRVRGVALGDEEQEESGSPTSQGDEDHLLSGGAAINYTQDIPTVDDVASNTDDGNLRSQPKLYPPGQILQLKNEEGGMTHGKWVGPEHFQEIIVGTTMMTDHLPDRVFLAINNFSETQRSGLNRL